MTKEQQLVVRFLSFVYAESRAYKDHVMKSMRYGHPGLQTYRLHELVKELDSAEDVLKGWGGLIQKYCDADNRGEAELTSAIAEVRLAAASIYIRGELIGKTQDGDFHIVTEGSVPQKGEHICFDGKRLFVANAGYIDRGFGRLEGFIVCRE